MGVAIVMWVWFRVVQQLRSLVAMNESLKRQEQQFKAHCKVSRLLNFTPWLLLLSLQEEKARLEEAIARLASEEGVVGEEEGERVAVIRQAFQADREKLGKIKALLVSVKWACVCGCVLVL